MPWKNESWSGKFLNACRDRRVELTEDVLRVSIGEKKLWHWAGGSLVALLDCSTSVRPPSNIENSLGTPIGLHAVAEKFGDEQPAGMVFVSREPTGDCYWQRADAGPQQKALVTSRILWLRGLEPGYNSGPGVDTYNRYVYIHGSNLQERIPEPLSAGCVLLRDADLLPLFDRIPCGTLVWIE